MIICQQSYQKYQLIEFRGTIFYGILNFDFCTSKKLLYLIGDIRSRMVPYVLNLGAAWCFCFPNKKSISLIFFLFFCLTGAKVGSFSAVNLHWKKKVVEKYSEIIRENLNSVHFSFEPITLFGWKDIALLLVLQSS